MRRILWLGFSGEDEQIGPSAGTASWEAVGRLQALGLCGLPQRGQIDRQAYCRAGAGPGLY